MQHPCKTPVEELVDKAVRKQKAINRKKWAGRIVWYLVVLSLWFVLDWLFMLLVGAIHGSWIYSLPTISWKASVVVVAVAVPTLFLATSLLRLNNALNNGRRS